MKTRIIGAGLLLCLGCGTCGAPTQTEPPPTAFDITGATSPGDIRADGWLATGDTVTANWKASKHAQRYAVSVVEDDGTTVKCPAVTASAEVTSMEVAGCSLIAGNRYKLSVTAVSTAGRVAATNDLFAFTVGYFVLGQPDAQTNLQVQRTMGSPTDFLVANGKVLVPDCFRNRVVIWNSFPTSNAQRPDLVLGQASLDTTTPNFNGPSASSMKCPGQISWDGTRLFLADSQNARVLIWNSFPTLSNQRADIVLGQPDFKTVTANTGSLNAASLGADVTGAFSDGTRIFVADGANNRVLVWTSIPSTSNQPANLVLGQPNFTSNASNNGGLSASTLAGPRKPMVIGGKLLVADGGNHRVLIWNSLPSTSQAPAGVVLGQPNMTSGGANAGGVSAQSFNLPMGAHAWGGPTAGGGLAVADRGNHRVLLWNAFPTQNRQGADLVLGQPNMTSNGPYPGDTGNPGGGGGPSAQTVTEPNGVWSDGTRTAVAESQGGVGRVTLWTSAITTNQQPANLVLGNSSLTGNVQPVDASTLSGISGVAAVGAGLAVATGENRVLRWATVPDDGSDRPTQVLGQPDMTSSKQGSITPDSNQVPLSAQSMNWPGSVSSDGVRLLTSEIGAARVLIWNSIPTANQTPANVVLGQPDMSTGDSAPPGSVSASTLSRWPGPRVHIQGTRVFVTDARNHRALIWNSVPTSNGQAANLVLGQPDFTSTTANNGGLGGRSLNRPTGIFSDGTRLFVADSLNHRVLIWNAVPTLTHQPADVVVGQQALDAATNVNPPTASTLSGPAAVYVANGRLYVSDNGNNRILFWDPVPTQTGQAASGVLGQVGFVTSLANSGGLTGRSLAGPGGIAVSKDTLFVADGNNNRLLGWPVP